MKKFEFNKFNEVYAQIIAECNSSKKINKRHLIKEFIENTQQLIPDAQQFIPDTVNNLYTYVKNSDKFCNDVCVILIAPNEDEWISYRFENLGDGTVNIYFVAAGDEGFLDDLPPVETAIPEDQVDLHIKADIDRIIECGDLNSADDIEEIEIMSIDEYKSMIDSQE